MAGDGERLLTIRATDTGACWQARFGGAGTEARRGAGDPGRPGLPCCVLDGPASGLYAFLWNRGDGTGLTVSGDPSVLDLWGSSVRVRW
jgi:hypothetical protein